MAAMKSRIAPDVFRKRLLVEGYFSREVSAEVVREYLLGLAAHLNLRTYGDAIVFAPASGMGRADNAGFDGFVPLIDSGISVYVWSAARFVSAVVYTCKDFDSAEAIAFTKTFFDCRGDFEAQEF
jgi:S-adenosylmethionine decarboxylase